MQRCRRLHWLRLTMLPPRKRRVCVRRVTWGHSAVGRRSRYVRVAPLRAQLLTLPLLPSGAVARCGAAARCVLRASVHVPRFRARPRSDAGTVVVVLAPIAFWASAEAPLGGTRTSSALLHLSLCATAQLNGAFELRVVRRGTGGRVVWWARRVCSTRLRHAGARGARCGCDTHSAPASALLKLAEPRSVWRRT